MRKTKSSMFAVIGMIAAVMMLGVSSSTADTNTTVFGSNNDEYGTFETSPTNGVADVWSLEADSVRWSFIDTGTNDTGQVYGSLLYANTLDRSSGSAYTIEGAVTLTDGYGDDNNRIGMLLFNDASINTNDGGGGIWMRLNTDQDTVAIVDGVAGTILATADTTGAYNGDGWITNAPLTFTGEVIFTNDVINLQFTLTDYDGVEDEVFTQVAESNYPGLYYGFATKWRNRGDTNSNRAVPPVIDYSSFSVSVSTNPPDTTSPSVPANVAASGGDELVSVTWDASPEPDTAYYKVYRSTTSGSGYSLIASDLTGTGYSDTGVANDTTYYYVVSAVDFSENESAQSAEASATPVAVEGIILFGSDFDGLAGFTQSDLGGDADYWVTLTNSVQYNMTNNGTINSSFLAPFELDTSDGASYTIEGVVKLTDGYTDDNNRVVLYLFGDSPSISDQNEPGAFSLVFNTDDGSAGSGDDNADDDLAFYNGIDNGIIATEVLRNQTVPSAQDLFGTEVTFTVDVLFTNMNGTNNMIVGGTFTDVGGITEVNGFTNDAAIYLNPDGDDYFGFGTRSRSRFYGDTNAPTAANRNLPWVMDYKSYLVEGGPAISGYALWAIDFGGTNTIGAATDDFDSDGVDNLNEYALDGDPTAPGDIGYVSYLTADGKYIHAQRSAAGDLIYTIQTTTDLVTGLWGDATPSVVSTNADGRTSGVDIITNTVGTVEDEKFIRLLIEQP